MLGSLLKLGYISQAYSLTSGRHGSFRGAEPGPTAGVMRKSTVTAITLPIILRPHQPLALERLGAHCDGGYLVDPRDIEGSDGLISMGIAIDWSFEKDFARDNEGPVVAYDGSLNIWYLMARTVRDALLLKSGNSIGSSARLVTDYLRFFSGRVKHIRSYVGKLHATYRKTFAPSVSFEEVLGGMRALGSSKPFLKIDIEGSEYSILSELVSAAQSTAGLAIEFHQCGKHMGEIADFVERYPLRLIHIHVNSYSPIDDCGCPGALELTFSSSAEENLLPPVLPHPLDRPNDGSSTQPEIQFV